MSTIPVYAVDLADTLADLEQRLNALARQRFEPWQVIPIARTGPPRRVGECPVMFVIVAVEQPRVVAIAELDYKSRLAGDHEGPAEPQGNGCRPPSITAAIPFSLVRR